MPFEFEQDDIVNPSQYEDKPEWGVVVQSGIGRTTENGIVIESGVEPGDVIVYGQYSSVVVRSNGVDFFYIRADDIMSVYKAKE